MTILEQHNPQIKDNWANSCAIVFITQNLALSATINFHLKQLSI